MARQIKRKGGCIKHTKELDFEYLKFEFFVVINGAKDQEIKFWIMSSRH